MATTNPNVPQRDDQVSNSSNIKRPFGHILGNSRDSAAQQQAPLARLRATSALGASAQLEYGNEMYQSQDNQTKAKTGRQPVYFNPVDGSAVGGLVCGFENDSKYTILKNVMASCLSPGEDAVSRSAPQGVAPKGFLCFTAENGSLRIVEAASSLAPHAQEEKWAEVIILTWPGAVEATKSMYAKLNLKNVQVTVLPLKIHWEDVDVDDMRHIINKADPHSSFPQSAETVFQSSPAALSKYNILPHLEAQRETVGAQAWTLLHNLQVHHFSSQLHEYTVPTPGYLWLPPQPWMEWTMNGQPALKRTFDSIENSAKPQSPAPPQSGSSPATIRPVILCVDFTAYSKENLVFQNVLANVVLKCWTDYYHAASAPLSGVGRNLVVCDHPELYLSESPFTRHLVQLISPTTLPIPLANASALWTDPRVATPKRWSHTSSNVVLLSHEPTSIPSSILDRLSYAIIHRFTSPRCLLALQNHFFLSDAFASPTILHGHSEVENASNATGYLNTLYDPQLMRRIMNLGDNQVLLFISSQSKTPFILSAPVASNTPMKTNGITHSPSESQNKMSYGGLQHGLTLVRLFNNEETEDPEIEDPELTRSMVYIINSNRGRPFEPDASNSSLLPQVRVGQGLMGRDLSPIRPVDVGGHYYTSNNVARDPPQLGTPNAPYANPYKTWAPTALNDGPTAVTGSAALGGEAEFFLSPGRNGRIPAAGVIGNNDAGIIGSNDYNGGSTRYSGSLLSPTTSRTARTMPPYGTGATSSQVPTRMTYSPGPISPPIGANKTTFSPFISPHHERDVYPLGSSPQPSSSSKGLQYTSDPVNFRVPSEGQSSNGRDSRDGSSGDYVEVGTHSGAESGAGKFSTSGSSFSRVTSDGPTAAVSNTGGFGLGGLVMKKSYAGVTAPSNDHTAAHQRQDLTGNLRNPIAMQDSVGSNSTASYSNTNRSTFPTAPSQDGASEPPPNYPLSFFWPLLDALDKARQQVSTPHNRAQSVRHSVVGQELPPAARARLGLTFKEYVAAAARVGVIVTGDSGDKAWIALREWKYPGKSIGHGGPHVHGHSSSQGHGGSSGSGSAAGYGGGLRMASK